MRRFLVVGIVLVFAGPLFAQSLTIDRVAWLQGCWRGTQGGQTIEEQWMAPRGGSMLGMGRAVRGSETTNYEMALVSAKDGRLVYDAHPSNQPPATFIAKTASTETVVFENPAHDFPQRVGYRRKGKDALLAWVEGDSGGKPQRVEYSYTRVNCEAP